MRRTRPLVHSGTLLTVGSLIYSLTGSVKDTYTHTQTDTHITHSALWVAPGEDLIRALRGCSLDKPATWRLLLPQ